MIKHIYDMTIKLITPSEKGSQLDFTTKQEDILEAACFFNEKFRSWSKRILIYMISKKSIHLLLFLESEKKQDNISAREIRFFTAYLNHQKNWKEYSRSSSKLFESVNTSLSNMEEAGYRVDSIEPESAIYKMQKEEIDYFLKQVLKIDALKARKAQSGEDDADLTDDEIIAVVTYLIRTKNKGTKREQKSETITQLKDLLRDWV